MLLVSVKIKCQGQTQRIAPTNPNKMQGNPLWLPNTKDYIKMSLIAKTIETTGFVNARHELLLDEQLPMIKPSRVRVIIFITEEDALFSEAEWLKTARQNPAFDFLKDKEEDIYSLTDGKPFYD